MKVEKDKMVSVTYELRAGKNGQVIEIDSSLFYGLNNIE